MINGYSIYVGGGYDSRYRWTVRVYRDADDEHIHSAENCMLKTGLDEAHAAIAADYANGPHPSIEQSEALLLVDERDSTDGR